MARKTTPKEGRGTDAGQTEGAEAPTLVRATYHLPPDLIDKLRDMAWWDRMTVNEVVRAALAERVHRLEQKRGGPYPKRGGVLRRGKPLA
jgi:hypothetical protein